MQSVGVILTLFGATRIGAPGADIALIQPEGKKKMEFRLKGAIAPLAVLLCTTLFAVNPASAAITTFAGSDDGVGPAGPRPLSDAAASAFNLAAGSTTLIDFESVPLGNTGSFTAAPGVSATYTGFDPAFGGVVSTSSVVLGYNTTSGGSKFFQFAPSFVGTAESLTLSFTSPVSGFGAYFTGTQSSVAGSIHVVFSDGTANDLALTKNSANGGVQFFGFLDPGSSISSITVSEVGPFNSRDIFGIDDIRLVPAAASGGSGVPLPLGAFAAVPLMGAMSLWKRRRTAPLS